MTFHYCLKDLYLFTHINFSGIYVYVYMYSDANYVVSLLKRPYIDILLYYTLSWLLSFVLVTAIL